MKVIEKWKKIRNTPLSKRGEIIYWVLTTNTIQLIFFAPIKNAGLKLTIISSIILRLLRNKKDKLIWIIVLFIFILSISNAILYYIIPPEYLTMSYKQNLH